MAGVPGVADRGRSCRLPGPTSLAELARSPRGLRRGVRVREKKRRPGEGLRRRHHHPRGAVDHAAQGLGTTLNSHPLPIPLTAPEPPHFFLLFLLDISPSIITMRESVNGLFSVPAPLF